MHTRVDELCRQSNISGSYGKFIITPQDKNMLTCRDCVYSCSMLGPVAKMTAVAARIAWWTVKAQGIANEVVCAADETLDLSQSSSWGERTKEPLSLLSIKNDTRNE